MPGLFTKSRELFTHREENTPFSCLLLKISLKVIAKGPVGVSPHPQLLRSASCCAGLSSKPCDAQRRPGLLKEGVNNLEGCGQGFMTISAE